MKRFFLMLGLLFVTSMAMAKGADIITVNQATSVYASTFSWTAAVQQSTTTANDVNADTGRDFLRIGIKFDLPAGATDQFLILMSPNSSSPTEALTLGDVYSPGDPPWLYAAGTGVYFYIRCLGTGRNKITYQQIRGNF